MSMAVPDGRRALGEGTVADHLAGLDQGSRAEGVTSEPSARYTRLMVALDTLAYVLHLESAGVPRAQAEAHAEAVASFGRHTGDETGPAGGRWTSRTRASTRAWSNLKVG